MNNVEMEINQLRATAMRDQCVVILKEKIANRYLPIWIAPAEADAIAVKIHNVSLSRPLTHDLLCKVIETYGGKVTMAIINELREDIFYAKLVLADEGKYHEVDCRPSDAIAVAVRAGAPIFADKAVLGQAGNSLEEEKGKLGEQQALVGQPTNESSKFTVFSKLLQRALTLSQEKVKEEGRDYINTGDLLLALDYVSESTSVKILSKLGIGQIKMRSAIESVTKERQRQESNDGALSINVKKAISLATEEAKYLNSDHICTECLLIGLLQEAEGIAAAVLRSLYVTREKVLGELVGILNRGGDLEHIKLLMQPL